MSGRLTCGCAHVKPPPPPRAPTVIIREETLSWQQSVWTAPFGTLLDPIEGRLEGLGVVLLQTTDADAAPQHVNPSVVLMLPRECWPNIKSTPVSVSVFAAAGKSVYGAEIQPEKPPCGHMCRRPSPHLNNNEMTAASITWLEYKALIGYRYTSFFVATSESIDCWFRSFSSVDYYKNVALKNR